MSLEPLLWTSYAFRLLIDQKMDVVFKCSRCSSLIRTRTQVIAGLEIAMHFAANVNATRDINNHVSNDFLHLCVACEGMRCGARRTSSKSSILMRMGTFQILQSSIAAFCRCWYVLSMKTAFDHRHQTHLSFSHRCGPKAISNRYMNLYPKPGTPALKKSVQSTKNFANAKNAKAQYSDHTGSQLCLLQQHLAWKARTRIHTHTQCDTVLHRVCTYLCLMRPSACHWGVCNPELRSEPVRATVAVLTKARAVGGKERTEEGRVVCGGKQRTYTGFVLLWW